jgi:hypothetical protein
MRGLGRAMPAVRSLSLFGLYGCQGLTLQDVQSLLVPRLMRSEIFGFLAGFGTTFAALPDLVSFPRRRSSAGYEPANGGNHGRLPDALVLLRSADRLAACDRLERACRHRQLSERWRLGVFRPAGTESSGGLAGGGAASGRIAPVAGRPQADGHAGPRCRSNRRERHRPDGLWRQRSRTTACGGGVARPGRSPAPLGLAGCSSPATCASGGLAHGAAKAAGVVSLRARLAKEEAEPRDALPALPSPALDRRLNRSVSKVTFGSRRPKKGVVRLASRPSVAGRPERPQGKPGSLPNRRRQPPSPSAHRQS